MFDAHADAGEYGLLPYAYMHEKTDGVVFEAALEVEGQRPRVLFERYLQPLTVEADCGMQKLALDVSTSVPAELVLRTGPGPANDTSCDWAYWGEVRLAPSRP